jgi:hypothetical protein
MAPLVANGEALHNGEIELYLQKNLGKHQCCDSGSALVLVGWMRIQELYLQRNLVKKHHGDPAWK